MLQLITLLLQLICYMTVQQIADFLRLICFWRRVPKSRRLTFIGSADTKHQR